MVPWLATTPVQSTRRHEAPRAGGRRGGADATGDLAGASPAPPWRWSQQYGGPSAGEKRRRGGRRGATARLRLRGPPPRLS